MEILNSFCNLCDDVTTEFLAKVCQSYDLVEQLSTWAEFENNVVELGRFGEIDQLDNVGVIELAHNLNFLEDVCSLKT